MFANGSSENHGCEAIKKATISILGDNQYFIGTTNINYESTGDGIQYIQYSFQKKYSIITRVLCRLGLMHNPKGRLELDQFVPFFESCDVALSVGGDNYCYGDNDWLYYLHEMALKAGKPTILWGVSVEASMIDNKMLSDFARFERIIVRESLSYKTLINCGIKNVWILPDPAFALKMKKPKDSDADFNENTRYIGINMSPLVERKEASAGIIQTNIKNLINYILEKTEYSIMLVPHVVTKDNDDYQMLKQIKSNFETDRIVLIEDHPCDELKYYISHCDMFIAARTHASIAAYSLCIPTLVIGYSVKSMGIAEDLFGTPENFVLPVENIDKNNKILEGFQWLTAHKNEIRAHLTESMPNYISETSKMRDIALYQKN